MKRNNIVFLSALLFSGLIYAQDNPQMAIPAAPATKPGQCHALVNVPAKLITKTQPITLQEAGETLEVIPDKYEWVEKKVLISEEVKTLELIPATYKLVEEQVMVEPERRTFEVIPAKYTEIPEKVMVKPAMRVWRKSRGGAASLSGEVMRLIEVPAQYETVVKRKMIEAPQIRQTVIPPTYSKIEKKVVDQPAHTREVIIPAEFKTIRVKELVKEAQEVRTPTQPIVENISSQEVAQVATLNWQRVPCDKDLNEANIIAIQNGLRKAGFKVTADGKFGKGSLEALEKFQEAKGLAKGAITIETMRALGVNID